MIGRLPQGVKYCIGNWAEIDLDEAVSRNSETIQVPYALGLFFYKTQSKAFGSHNR